MLVRQYSPFPIPRYDFPAEQRQITKLVSLSASSLSGGSGGHVGLSPHDSIKPNAQNSCGHPRGGRTILPRFSEIFSCIKTTHEEAVRVMGAAFVNG